MNGDVLIVKAGEFHDIIKGDIFERVYDACISYCNGLPCAED
jgi:hypothetical protein